MERKVEKLENCKTVVKFAVNGEEWKVEVEKAYKKLEKNVTVPGFRKGKAPQKMVEQHLGVDYIKNTALDNLLPKAFVNLKRILCSDFQPKLGEKDRFELIILS